MTDTATKSPKKPKKYFDKNGNAIRTEQLNIRLTVAELEKLTAKAEEHQLPIATFLRDRILELSPPVKRMRDLPTIDPEFYGEISRIGKNINRLTKIANTELANRKTPNVNKLIEKLSVISNQLEELREQYSVKPFEELPNDSQNF